MRKKFKTRNDKQTRNKLSWDEENNLKASIKIETSFYENLGF